jgi:hypothetical protein
MKNRAIPIGALLILVLASLACALSPELQALAPTLEAGAQTAAVIAQTAEALAQTALPTIQGSIETTLPTLQSGISTAVPALQTMLPPALRPGEGLPLPGTLIPKILSQLTDVEAEAVLEAYSLDVFGRAVDVTVGRSLVGDLNLPGAIETEATTAQQLAGKTYFGLLADGAIALSLGNTLDSSDIAASVQEASLGIISRRMPQVLPAEAAMALALIHQVYPNLATVNLEYMEYTVDNGYTFRTTTTDNWGIHSGEIVLKGTIITAGVKPGRKDGDVNVWAVVAAGSLAAPFSK